MTKDLRVGVDIGGTFTDIVVQDKRDGTTLLHKVLSTPDKPSLGMLHGLDELGITERHRISGSRDNRRPERPLVPQR